MLSLHCRSIRSCFPCSRTQHGCPAQTAGRLSYLSGVDALYIMVPTISSHSLPWALVWLSLSRSSAAIACPNTNEDPEIKVAPSLFGASWRQTRMVPLQIPALRLRDDPGPPARVPRRRHHRDSGGGGGGRHPRRSPGCAAGAGRPRRGRHGLRPCWRQTLGASMSPSGGVCGPGASRRPCCSGCVPICGVSWTRTLRAVRGCGAERWRHLAPPALCSPHGAGIHQGSFSNSTPKT